MPTEYPDWFKESFLELEDDITEATEANRRVPNICESRVLM
jgi:hypothetical protein